MSRYLKPRDHGYLMEAAACVRVLGNLQCIEARLTRAVERKGIARQAEFEKAVQYHSKRELQGDLGWGFIAEAQYDRYRLLFQQGQTVMGQLPLIKSELVLRLVRRIMANIGASRRKWEFPALSPEDQRAERARTEQSQKEWKRKAAELKRKRGIIEVGEDMERG